MENSDKQQSSHHITQPPTLSKQSYKQMLDDQVAILSRLGNNMHPNQPTGTIVIPSEAPVRKTILWHSLL